MSRKFSCSYIFTLIQVFNYETFIKVSPILLLESCRHRELIEKNH